MKVIYGVLAFLVARPFLLMQLYSSMRKKIEELELAKPSRVMGAEPSTEVAQLKAEEMGCDIVINSKVVDVQALDIFINYSNDKRLVDGVIAYFNRDVAINA